MANHPHVPTADQLAQVEALAGYGVRQDEIATYIGIAPKTLRLHYREGLDRGMIKANLSVARSLHKMATEGGNVAAAIFWLKARAGWREKDEAATQQQQTSVMVVPMAASMDEWAGYAAKQQGKLKDSVRE